MTDPTAVPLSAKASTPVLVDEAAARQDLRLDEALDETFPASDPLSFSKID